MTEKAKLLSRDDVLAARDIKTKLVAVPEWGGDVYVKGMTGTDLDAFETTIIVDHGGGKKQTVTTENIRAKLAAFSIVDEDGVLMFSVEDIDALGKKSSSALQRIMDVAKELSGIGDDEIEDLAEGLKADPFVDSASD